MKKEILAASAAVAGLAAVAWIIKDKDEPLETVSHVDQLSNFLS